MKTSTAAVITVATLFAMGACAKKDRGLKAKADPKVESQQAADTRKAQTIADRVGSSEKYVPAKSGDTSLPEGAVPATADSKDVGFVLTRSYIGDMLMLTYPNKGNFGQIVVDDDDAKAIYDALRIKVEAGPANEIYLSQKIKRGQQILCYLSVRKDAPTAQSYSCMVNIDYVTGAVSFPHGITFDEQVPALTEKRVGNNVFLNPAAVPPVSAVANRDARATEVDLSAVAALPRPLATIHFNGPDAKALYSTLGAEAVSQAGRADVAMVKTGHNISCLRSIPAGTSQFNFACRLMFNFQTGKMLEQITGAEDVYVPGTQPTLDDTKSTSGILVDPPNPPLDAAPTAGEPPPAAGAITPAANAPTPPGTSAAKYGPVSLDGSGTTGSLSTAPPDVATFPVTAPTATTTTGTATFGTTGYRPLGPTTDGEATKADTAGTTAATTATVPGKQSENLK